MAEKEQPGESIYDQEESYMADNASLSDPTVLFLALTTFVWIVVRWQQPGVNLPGGSGLGQWDIVWIVIILLVTLGKTGFLYLRWKSPKIISNPINTSTVGYESDTAGIYNMYTINDIGYIFHEHGKAGTIIAPKAYCIPRGRNIDISAPLEKIPIEEIPPSVLSKIVQRGFKPPYWRGYVDASIVEALPEIQYLKDENKELTKTVHMQKRQINLIIKLFEDIASGRARIEEERVRTKVKNALSSLGKWGKDSDY